MELLEHAHAVELVSIVAEALGPAAGPLTVRVNEEPDGARVCFVEVPYEKR